MTRAEPGWLPEAVAAARDAWPGVEVESSRFAAWVDARVSADQTPGDLRTSDLWLACACAAGDPRAMQRFDEAMFEPAAEALRRLSLPAAAIDETIQVLRRRFFVGEDGGTARIADYSGRGDLRKWVRAAAIRAAFRVVRRPKGQIDVDSSVMRAVVAPAEDLELDYLKRRYAREFEEALRASFADLSTRDRNVVRYYFAEGLGIDGIAGIYRIHRATAARWVHQITTTLMNRSKERLREQLRADRKEVSSIVRLLQSQLEVVMRAVVGRQSPI